MNSCIPLLNGSLTLAGIITLAVMPNAFINANHADVTLGRLLDDVPMDEVASALGVDTRELSCECRASPSLADAVAAIMDRLSSGNPEHGYLVRYLCPHPGGGYETRLTYGHSLEAVAQRMMRA